MEDDRTTLSEPMAVDSATCASNDKVTAVADGQWPEPADNNNVSRTNDNQLSPRTETLNTVNKLHGQSRDHENVNTVDNANTVNRKWSTHDVKQSGVEMNGIPTTTKNVRRDSYEIYLLFLTFYLFDPYSYVRTYFTTLNYTKQ